MTMHVTLILNFPQPGKQVIGTLQPHGQINSIDLVQGKESSAVIDLPTLIALVASGEIYSVMTSLYLPSNLPLKDKVSGFYVKIDSCPIQIKFNLLTVGKLPSCSGMLVILRHW
jgi:hypothetical protein